MSDKVAPVAPVVFGLVLKLFLKVLDSFLKSIEWVEFVLSDFTLNLHEGTARCTFKEEGVNYNEKLTLFSAINIPRAAGDILDLSNKHIHGVKTKLMCGGQQVFNLLEPGA